MESVRGTTAKTHSQTRDENDSADNTDEDPPPNGALQRIFCGDTPDRPTDQTKSHNEPDGYLDGDALPVVARRPHLEAGCTAPGRFEEDRSGAVVAFRGSCPERKEELME